MYHKLSRVLVALIAVVMLTALIGVSGTVVSAAAPPVGFVFTSTNAAGGNSILRFARAADGSLTSAGSFSTGGLGTGAGLGSQGSVALTLDGKRLFVVNAGSNTISMFDVRDSGLVLRSQTASNGATPISLTVHGNVLYVLNAGTPANISGFKIGAASLNPITGSTLPLSASAPGPAEVSFNPRGTALVVTEKSTSKIDAYTVNTNGLANDPQVFPSVGNTPFGFAFDIHGHPIVSEAGPGALSSYSLASNGALNAISPSVSTAGQLAACWVVTTQNGRFAYTANAHSGTISGFGDAPNGTLTLLTANGITATTGGTPLDLAISSGDQYLYALNVGTQMINIFKIGANGSLTGLGNALGMPTSGAGLAAR